MPDVAAAHDGSVRSSRVRADHDRGRGAATVARLRRGRLLEVPGNHITFAYGASAERVAAALLAFLIGGADAVRSVP